MRVGLIGFGNIGRTLVAQVAEAKMPLAHLCVLCRPNAEDEARAILGQAFKGTTTEVVTGIDGLLASRPDLVIECAGHQAVTELVPAVLQAGIEVVVVSVGALAHQAVEGVLRAAAEKAGSRYILPAGAIGGIDLLSAISAVGGCEVKYRGTKPPKAWAGTPAADILDLNGLRTATAFFQADARRAARDFPKNANVAATLALAGAGFEATQVELVADPAAAGNIHEYEVISPLATYSIRIENRASGGNAKTSAATVFSVLREIRNRIGPQAI
jgi:aspartate dehydrogenase